MNRTTTLRIIMLAGVALLANTSARASYTQIVNSATIRLLANYSDSQSFVIAVSGGTGPCANSVITFPQSAAVDTDSFKRTYAAVMLAYSTDASISIDSSIDGTCSSATYIVMSAQ